jgi:hypothetical protein
MKTFTTLKVGYTAALTGCSNEYFNTIIVDGSKMFGIAHKGLYGSDNRVNKLLKSKGFSEVYIPTAFGRMLVKDINKHLFKTEGEANKFINNGFKDED